MTDSNLELPVVDVTHPAFQGEPSRETLDEHFYAWHLANARFARAGLGLSDATLKKLYRDNALKLLKKP